MNDDWAAVIRDGLGAHWYVWQDDEGGATRTARDDVNCPVCAAEAALDAVAAELADLRQALERIAKADGYTAPTLRYPWEIARAALAGSVAAPHTKPTT